MDGASQTDKMRVHVLDVHFLGNQNNLRYPCSGTFNIMTGEPLIVSTCPHVIFVPTKS